WPSPASSPPPPESGSARCSRSARAQSPSRSRCARWPSAPTRPPRSSPASSTSSSPSKSASRSSADRSAEDFGKRAAFDVAHVDGERGGDGGGDVAVGEDAQLEAAADLRAGGEE